MTECNQQVKFNFDTPKRLEVLLTGIELSSDAGLLLIRQAEARERVCEGIAARLPDPREAGKIKHSILEMIAQRVYQIAGGYEDVNDSNYLRHDPILKIACGREPIAAEELLASQSTQTRLDQRVREVDIAALRRLYVELFIARYKEAPAEIVLDIDGWDAQTYGEQQLSFFHGYYEQHMYFPVLINEAISGYPLVMQLRAGNSHPGKGVAALLRWLFWRLRRAWPSVRIIIRGDAGFSLPELMRLCERSDVGYAFGYSRNEVLKRKISDLLERARLTYCRTQQKARLFDDVYYAAATWTAPRRLIMKAEWLDKGANPRFVVTNLDFPAQKLYDDFYVQRAEGSENRIKEIKLGIKAGRLSCQQFIANQFHLLLSQAAYILMLAMRQAAQGTALAKAQVTRLRQTLIKIAARVRVSARRILVELPAHCPFAAEFSLIAQRLSSSVSGMPC